MPEAHAMPRLRMRHAPHAIGAVESGAVERAFTGIAEHMVDTGHAAGSPDDPQPGVDTLAFTAKGGIAVMTLPTTPLKCAGAPLKMSLTLRDRLLKAGTLGASKTSFPSALGNVLGVKVVNDNVLERWSSPGIAVVFSRKFTAIDIGARRATFVFPEGERQEMPCDFMHVVPPMRAPDAVNTSDLAWKEDPFAAGGWLEVDKGTLQHRHYPSVFGIGDLLAWPLSAMCQGPARQCGSCRPPPCHRSRPVRCATGPPS